MRRRCPRPSWPSIGRGPPRAEGRPARAAREHPRRARQDTTAVRRDGSRHPSARPGRGREKHHEPDGHGENGRREQRVKIHDTTIEQTFYFGKISIEWWTNSGAPITPSCRRPSTCPRTRRTDGMPRGGERAARDDDRDNRSTSRKTAAPRTPGLPSPGVVTSAVGPHRPRSGPRAKPGPLRAGRGGRSELRRAWSRRASPDRHGCAARLDRVRPARRTRDRRPRSTISTTVRPSQPSAASCPQAAAISCPLVSRTVQLTPPSWTRRTNSRSTGFGLASHLLPGVGFSGIRFTCTS
ncbi:hypothetical protein AHOG_08445 [Actinoalloteichus hoggarensis]|uniref:Uncharacterized protein n=1 Tax=Actinoalloteichus hoggarensis TaxID=1470176 RepID=A0A221W0P7_9PSEU|nr:hypothetical protein AHOG_08445 [Actinoalloteichus hoggarensis]